MTDAKMRTQSLRYLHYPPSPAIPLSQVALKDSFPRPLRIQPARPQAHAHEALEDALESGLRVGDRVQRVHPDLRTGYAQGHRAAPAPVGEPHGPRPLRRPHLAGRR